MKVTRLSEAESYEPEENWTRTSLCAEENISVEHFVKPPGHSSPVHDHENAQVLIALEGKLTVTTDNDGSEELDVGDAVYIPGGESHVVANPLDTPSAGIDIFVPGRSFDFWLKRLKR